MEQVIPKLRFPEFEGNWENKKLREITEINPSNKKLPDNFIYIDLESVENGQLKKENLVSADEAPSRAQRVLLENDVLFQMVRPYQMNNLFFDKIGNYVASTGYAQIRTKQNSKYLFQYLHFQKFVDKVIERCTGTSYPAINSTDLSNITVSFPSLPEQTKIATFLTAVDEKLQALKQKKNLLEQYKKGVMQKIFSQELRFKDDNGNEYPDWEKKKLGDICEIAKSGGTPKSTKSEYYDGDIPFLSISDMTSQGKYLNYTSNHISELGLVNSSSWIVPANSIIYSMYASVGFVAINNIPLATSQAVLNLILKNSVNTDYIYYTLVDFKKKIAQFITTGTQGNLNAQSVKGFVLAIPSLSEQTKIANFLSAIDEKINHCGVQIEKMEVWKKGLLQQMFC